MIQTKTHNQEGSAMSDKKEVRRKIRNWCNTELRKYLLGWAVNLEPDNTTLHIALPLRGQRTTEIDNKITELRKQFPEEVLQIDLYERPQKKKK